MTHYFSTKKAQQLLGYEPLVPMEVAVQRTVSHLRTLGLAKRPPSRAWRWGRALALVVLLLILLVL